MAREGSNQHADDLSNEKFDDFTPGLRIDAEWERLDFRKLKLLLKHAESFRGHVQKLKQDVKHDQADSSGTRKKQRVKLRDRDPW